MTIPFLCTLNLVRCSHFRIDCFKKNLAVLFEKFYSPLPQLVVLFHDRRKVRFDKIIFPNLSISNSSRTGVDMNTAAGIVKCSILSGH